jgi:hypothetical protein
MVKKVMFALGAVGLLLAGLAIRAQLSKPKTYLPSETQTLRLKVKQDAAVIAQKDMQVVQQRFQDALNALNSEAEKVKVENRWPKDVKFSPDTLTFDMPKLAPLPSPAPTPTQKQ